MDRCGLGCAKQINPAGLFRPVNQIEFIQQQFRHEAGYALNLRNPRSFNEKLQWLNLFYQMPELTSCCDKIKVKEYVRMKLGQDICLPTLAIYCTAEEFNPDVLPEPFVLKLNSGSGEVMFCRSRPSLDRAVITRQLRDWLRPGSNHYFHSFEWGYKDIVPRIRAEPMLAEPATLTDYKFFCFDGEPRCLLAATNRTKKLYVDFFDLDWSHLPFAALHPNSPIAVPRPEKLAEMTEYARALAKGFPFVRVDLYCPEGQIFFGELTFRSGAGMEPFTPREWGEKLGGWLTLPDHALFTPQPGKPSLIVSREQLNAFLLLVDSPQTEMVETKAERMQKSFSWRITAPLRADRRLISKLARVKRR